MKQEVIQRAEEQPIQQGPNLTGIPTQMKLDFEQRSGLSFDDVRVHYNSDKPRKIGALAYTQGTQVHVGPGQERHLRHELGHVVQQKRGIVRPNYRLGQYNLTYPLTRRAQRINYTGSLPQYIDVVNTETQYLVFLVWQVQYLDSSGSQNPHPGITSFSMQITAVFCLVRLFFSTADNSGRYNQG